MSLWKKGKDNLQNGAILGGVLGVAMIFGEDIIGFLQSSLPTSWMVLGQYSVYFYVVSGMVVVGYLLDRY